MDEAPPSTAPVPGWTPPPRPPREAMAGRLCRIVPLDAAAHAAPLHAALHAREGWDYLPYGPFGDADAHRAHLAATFGDDPLAHVIEAGGEVRGIATYLRINPLAGSIEVGHIHLGPALQRTPAATEAMHLMMARAFDLGYRRYEWKCDAANAASRRAALRLGFTYEGTHRQATIVKGRNRDTAWFSILDREWPRVRDAQAAWLDPANFDAEGRQRTALSAGLTTPR